MPHLPFLSKDHEQRYDTPPSHSLYVCREEEEPEAMEDAEDEKDSKPPVGEARSPGQAEFPKQQTESNISMEDSRASPGDMFVRSFMTVERLSSHKPSSTRTPTSLHPSSQKRQKSWWRRERKIQRSQTPGVSISQPSAVDK